MTVGAWYVKEHDEGIFVLMRDGVDPPSSAAGTRNWHAVAEFYEDLGLATKVARLLNATENLSTEQRRKAIFRR